jgi:hypothetical protein
MKTIRQKYDESLRDYVKCFYNARNTIPYIQDIEIINAFRDGVDIKTVEEITMKKPKTMIDLLVVTDMCIEASEARGRAGAGGVGPYVLILIHIHGFYSAVVRQYRAWVTTSSLDEGGVSVASDNEDVLQLRRIPEHAHEGETGKRLECDLGWSEVQLKLVEGHWRCKRSCKRR